MPRQRAEPLPDIGQQSHMEGRPTESRITVIQSTPPCAALAPARTHHPQAFPREPNKVRGATAECKYFPMRASPSFVAGQLRERGGPPELHAPTCSNYQVKRESPYNQGPPLPSARASTTPGPKSPPASSSITHLTWQPDDIIAPLLILAFGRNERPGFPLPP